MAATAQIKSTLLSEWATLQHRRANVLVLGTSNYPENLDGAFLRRMTARFLVACPEAEERAAMLRHRLSIIHSDVPDGKFSTIWSANAHIDLFTGANVTQMVDDAINIAEMDNYHTQSWAEVNNNASLLPRYAIFAI